MKNNVLILGGGRQGNLIANGLYKIGHNIEVWDINKKNLEKLPLNIKKKIRDFRKYKPQLSYFDLIIDALPSSLGIEAIRTAIENKVSIVSISFTPETPLSLNNRAKKNGVLVIPDAGLAPGISNLLSGFSYSILNGADTLIIKVGGIPLHPEPPFNYEITWSPEDLIDEYIRPARIKRNGKIIKLPALSNKKKESIGKYKNLESFLTDGLRTILYTLPIKNMEERTIRYQSHSELIKDLKLLGFFDSSPIIIDNRCKISPKKFTAGIFSHFKKNSKDLVLLNIIMKNGRKSIEFSLIEKGKKEEFAMARTTGYTAVVASSMFLDGLIKQKGVVPLEVLGKNLNFTFEFLKRLKAFGINIQMKSFPDKLIPEKDD